MDHKVIAITGPTGSGKSTISLALAKKFDRCVYLDVDHVKHMVVSGFSYTIGKGGEKVWHYSEWKQVGESVGILCANFLQNDFGVVVGGYMYEEAWRELEKQVDLTHKFLLLPSKETIKYRDVERDSKYTMGDFAIKEHFDYIEQKEIFRDFAVIDSTDQSVDQTLETLITHIENH